MNKTFWKDLSNRWPIVALAPMDWHTDSPYRIVTKKIAPHVVTFAEFYSADWLVKSEFLASKVLPHKESEKPVIFQIFWNNPEMFAKAWVIIENYWAGWIDINMWCPAKKVIKNWYGSWLMIDTKTAFAIVRALSNVTNLPVSVKTRLWWWDTSDLIRFCKWLEDSGANLISVHWRTYENKFTWAANWDPIYELQDALKIPVLWNWDVLNYDDWILKQKNLAWFMIWRASMWNPWCFLKWWYSPDLTEICDIMRLHTELFVERSGEKYAITNMRKHLVSYIKWFEWVRDYRKILATAPDLNTIYSVIEEIRTIKI